MLWFECFKRNDNFKGKKRARQREERGAEGSRRRARKKRKRAKGGESVREAEKKTGL
jgi:hypothetical protein